MVHVGEHHGVAKAGVGEWGAGKRAGACGDTVLSPLSPLHNQRPPRRPHHSAGRPGPTHETLCPAQTAAPSRRPTALLSGHCPAQSLKGGQRRPPHSAHIRTWAFASVHTSQRKGVIGKHTAETPSSSSPPSPSLSPAPSPCPLPSPPPGAPDPASPSPHCHFPARPPSSLSLTSVCTCPAAVLP